jgi:abequosyltransferase
VITEKPLLSICLPTYNRDYMLDLLLYYLSPLTLKYNIPIYISDNNSPDDTEKIVFKYMKTNPNIFYYKQIENIGADKNFEYLLLNSNSKYKWLLSDSTILKEEELVRFLNSIKNTDYDFIITGSENRTDKYPSKFYANPSELLEDLGWHMTYLSCLIYNERVFDKCTFSRYYNSRFLQTGVIFEYIITHTCNVFFDNEIKTHVLNVTDADLCEKRDHWDNIVFAVFSRDWYLFVMSLPVLYTYESKNICIRKHAVEADLFNPDYLLKLKCNGWITYEIFKKEKFFIRQTVAYKKYLEIFFVSIIPYFLLPHVYVRKIKILIHNICQKIKKTNVGKVLLNIKHKLEQKN